MYVNQGGRPVSSFDYQWLLDGRTIQSGHDAASLPAFADVGVSLGLPWTRGESSSDVSCDRCRLRVVDRQQRAHHRHQCHHAWILGGAIGVRLFPLLPGAFLCSSRLRRLRLVRGLVAAPGASLERAVSPSVDIPDSLREELPPGCGSTRSWWYPMGRFPSMEESHRTPRTGKITPLIWNGDCRHRMSRPAYALNVPGPFRIDWALLHELGHARSLADLYRFDFPVDSPSQIDVRAANGATGVQPTRSIWCRAVRSGDSPVRTEARWYIRTWSAI